MATRLKEVDAVMVGVGWTGSILARELTKAGLTVVGIERGPDRVPAQDFALPGIRDELKWGRRPELFQDTALDTITFRHFPGEDPLPMRRWAPSRRGRVPAGPACIGLGIIGVSCRTNSSSKAKRPRAMAAARSPMT